MEPEFIYQSKELEQDQALRLVDSLKKCKVKQCGVQFEVATDFQLDKILLIYQRLKDQASQIPSTQHSLNQEVDQGDSVRKGNRPTYVAKINKNITKLDKTWPYKNVLSFQKSGTMFMQLFAQVYKDRLKELATEFNVLIDVHRNDILIYRKTAEAQGELLQKMLMILKNQLNIYYCHESDIMDKVRYSPHLKETLSLKKVNSYLFYENKLKKILFYSITLKHTQMRAVIEKDLQYDVKIIKLKTDLDAVSKRVFTLIEESGKPFVNYIWKQYEMVLESNKRECAYVLHNRHSTFAEQPVKQFKQFLKKYKIFALKTRKSIALNNHLKEFKRTKTWLKETYDENRRISYLMVDSSALRQEDLLSLLSVFLLYLNIDAEIEVYVSHLIDGGAQQIYRVQDHVGKEKLLRNKEGYNWASLKLRDFSETLKEKKQREILRFFNAYLFGSPEIQLTEENIERSLVPVEQEDASFQIKALKSENVLAELEAEVDQYLSELTYVQPKSVPGVYYQKLKKIKKVQEILNRESKNVFKVYQIGLNKEINTPTEIPGKPFLVREAFGTDGLISGKKVSIQDFGTQQIGFIVWRDPLSQRNIPCYQFERIE